jgi:hypothetical protein
MRYRTAREEVNLVCFWLCLIAVIILGLYQLHVYRGEGVQDKDLICTQGGAAYVMSLAKMIPVPSKDAVCKKKE